VDGSVEFVDCPAYADERGTIRCGLPAEVEDRYTMTSTDGPLDSARIRCPRGHFFNGPIEAFSWGGKPAGGSASNPLSDPDQGDVPAEKRAVTRRSVGPNRELKVLTLGYIQ
jgi:hypothetical protein